METITENGNHHEEFASKGVGNTALGLSIGALGVELLRGGLGNLFGGLTGDSAGARVASYELSEIDTISTKQCNDYIELTKAFYNLYITSLLDDYSHRQTDISEKFGLYQNDILNTLKLGAEISDLKSLIAVMAAIQPYQNKIIENEIADARKDAAYGITLEAQRRGCSDNALVLYMNGTFNPLTLASADPGSTTVNYTSKGIYNPLCCLGLTPCSNNI